jgi:hypothetical protein
MKMPKMGGFTKFLKAHLDTSAIGVVLAGLALPAVTFMVADRLNLTRKLNNLPVVGTALANPFGQAALGIGAMALLNYGLVSAGVMKENTAVAAGTVAIGLFAAQALVRQFPGKTAEIFPFADRVSAPISGYRGGYLGYLGNAHMGMHHGNMGEMEMLPAPQNEQLFGMGSAPKVNVF